MNLRRLYIPYLWDVVEVGAIIVLATIAALIATRSLINAYTQPQQRQQQQQQQQQQQRRHNTVVLPTKLEGKMQLLTALAKKFGPHFKLGRDTNGDRHHEYIVVSYGGHEWKISETFAEALLESQQDIIGIIYEIGFNAGAALTQGM